MMLICEECGKKYQLDPARIKGAEARFACKRCGHMITVKNPGAARKWSPAALPPSAGRSAAEARALRTAPAPAGVEKGLPGPEKPRLKKIICEGFPPPTRLRFGLTLKLFSVMILVSLVPLVLFWGITLSQARNRIQIETIRHSTQLFSGMVQYVNEWFAEKERIIKALAEMDAMASMDGPLQESLLQAAVNIYPHLQDVFVLDKNGALHAGAGLSALQDPAVKSFLQERLHAQGISWRMVKNDETLKPVLLVAAPIRNASGVVGAMVHSTQIDRISKQILSHAAGQVGFAFLITAEQATDAYQIDIQGLHQKRLDWSTLIGAFGNGQTGLLTFQDREGRSVLGYIGRTAFGWGIALQKSQTEVAVLLAELTSAAYILLAVITLFVSVIAWFSGRAISKPILKLTNAANRISIGELDMEIRSKRKDEIGDLSEAIARMQASIRISIERLRRRR